MKKVFPANPGGAICCTILRATGAGCKPTNRLSTSPLIVGECHANRPEFAKS
jgi:hypothetical protein